jgi:UDP-N-acetylmuramate dehydrogenase
MQLQSNVKIAPYTTFKIGGEAYYFAIVRTIEDLKEVADFLNKSKLPFFCLGEGSNTLAADEGFHGLVIKNEILGVKIKDLDYRTVEIVAGAGENWDSLVKTSVARNLYGLENLSWIPGTVGAAPVQNIGAYGAEVKDSITSVEVFDLHSGEIKTLSNDECEFSYRDSFFKRPENKSLIITKVTFHLAKEGRVNIGYKDLKERFKEVYSSAVSVSDVRNAVIEIRQKKLPDWKIIGTAGSFFKNPIIDEKHFETLKKEYPEMPSFSEPNGKIKIPLAWIIDKVCNFKGVQEGNVGTYITQPLALVNYGGGTFLQIESLAKKIENLVFEKTKIKIEREVQILK